MRERPTTLSLETIEIANPCPASWDRMHGDDRVRFCEACQLNVYNLSAMSRDAATKLLADHGATRGRLCIRLYKRADGTVITTDCGGGLRAATVRAVKFAGAAAAAALCAALAPVFLASAWRSSTVSTSSPSSPTPARIASTWSANASVDVVRMIKSWLTPLFPARPVAPPPLMGKRVMMGGAPAPPRTVSRPPPVAMGELASPR